MSQVKIYKDLDANAVFMENPNGGNFINALQAILGNVSDTCSIINISENIEIESNIHFSNFVDKDGNAYGVSAQEVCDELNTMLSATGTPSTNLPEITSSLAISLVEGETLNYELTANYGVGYEWDLSNVSGVTTVEGNVRKIIGGSGLSAGTYNIPIKAINYNGEDSQTVVLTVSSPPFANTKSVKFNQNDWLGANAALLDSTLGRSGNGSGSSDAWSIAFWLKTGGSSNQDQTIFYFGSNDVANGNHIRIKWNGANNSREQLIFQYGSSNNNLTLKTPVGSVLGGSGWHHFLITYDGGITGANSGDINDYYSRFKIFKNGTQLTTINSNSNYGITSALSGQNLRVGRYNNSGYMRSNCKLDELAVWDSDQSANVLDIYNSGIPFDLSKLSVQPKHWWRMGDGDTYPNLQDSGTEANCTFVMYNMTAADIVNDVPQ